MFYVLLFPSLILSEELILEKADSVEYKGSLLTAENPEFTLNNKRFLAKSLLADLSSQTIKAKDVDIFSEGWHLFGKEIVGEGDSLEIKDGWFTACPSEKPHYRFTSKKITLTKNKVKARNLTFRLKEIPILWLPGYSYNLKAAESPYHFELGKCSKKGIFLKSKYLFQQEFGDLSFSLDLYQKKGIGLGGEIKKEDAKANLYYADERWAVDGLFKTENITAKTESYKDQDILVDYFDQKPKDEVKNLLYLEKASSENIARIGLEDRKIWKGKEFEPERFSGFLSFSNLPQPIGGLITDSDVSFSTDGTSQIQGKIGKGFSQGNLSFFQLVGFTAGYKEDTTDEALTQESNIRGNLSEIFEWNMEYNTAYSLEKKEMTKRDIGLSVFTDIGKARLKIGTEFDCKTSQSETEMESDLALERGLSLSFDGVYGKKKKERINIKLAKERYNLDLSVLAKEKEPLLFYPSLTIRPKQGLSISATGYISEEEIREIKTRASFLIHCIKTGFNLSWRNESLKVGLDFGLNLP
ncbi:MAG: hypothetical protein V2A53_05315 [bacterium]